MWLGKCNISHWAALNKGSDWIRLVFAHPFPLNNGAPVASANLRLEDTYGGKACPTNGGSVIQDQRVGTIQSLSSLTLWLMVGSKFLLSFVEKICLLIITTSPTDLKPPTFTDIFSILLLFPVHWPTLFSKRNPTSEVSFWEECTVEKKSLNPVHSEEAKLSHAKCFILTTFLWCDFLTDLQYEDCIPMLFWKAFCYWEEVATINVS